MIGYRYFRGDFRYLRGLRQSTLFGLRWAREDSIIPHAL